MKRFLPFLTTLTLVLTQVLFAGASSASTTSNKDVMREVKVLALKMNEDNVLRYKYTNMQGKFITDVYFFTENDIKRGFALVNIPTKVNKLVKGQVMTRLESTPYVTLK